MKFNNSIFILLVLLCLISCSDSNDNVVTDSGKLKNDNFTEVISTSISPGGGTIKVSTQGSEIEGLEITIPPDAFTESKNFKISYAKIKEHNLGSYFNPVTPIIKIENGGKGLSKFYMTLKIPINIPKGYFPLAYYYDRETGKVEGITPLEITDTYIKVAVRHFSEVGITALTDKQKDILKQGEAFDSWFYPSDHGWSFPNYGTYPTYKGNCAGMTLSAMWFYRKNPSTLTNSGTNLTGMFDNDQLYFRTPTTWEDDVLGLKFVTVVQNKYFESAWTANQKVASDLQNSDEIHFWSLVYSMLVENGPEFIFVSATGAGHAIMAYGWRFEGDKCKILCYDPNYPGKTNNLTFNLSSGSFNPYTSALNAKAMEDGDVYNFDKIYYIPLSSICDVAEMQTLWNQVSTKKIGEELFPAFKVYIEYTDPETSETQKVYIEDMQSDKTNFLNVTPNDALEFKYEGPNGDTRIDVYYLNKTKVEKRSVTTFNLEEKSATYGICFWIKPSGSNNFSWSGFRWFKLNQTTIEIKSTDSKGAPVKAAGELDTEYELYVENKGETPKNPRYEWDFGDKNKQEVKGKSNVKHSWKTAGIYTITVKMFDDDTKQLIGSTNATAGFGGYCKLNLDGSVINFSPFGASYSQANNITAFGGATSKVQGQGYTLALVVMGNTLGNYTLTMEGSQVMDYNTYRVYICKSGSIEITEYGPVLTFINGTFSGTFIKMNIMDGYKVEGEVSISGEFSAIRSYDQ